LVYATNNIRESERETRGKEKLYAVDFTKAKRRTDRETSTTKLKDQKVHQMVLSTLVYP